MPAPTHGRLPATRGGLGSTAARRRTIPGPRLPGATPERRAEAWAVPPGCPGQRAESPCAPCRDEKPSQIGALNVFARGASLALAAGQEVTAMKLRRTVLLSVLALCCLAPRAASAKPEYLWQF